MAYFTVLPHRRRVPAQTSSSAYLLTDNWDDWFQFETLFHLIIVDDKGNQHGMGGVKIGQFDMVEGQKRPDLPDRFDQLDDRFFSLGQSDSYYHDVNKLGAVTRDNVLSGPRLAGNRPVGPGT